MDNPQAFPTHGGTEGDDARNRILTGGMTLRDYFAGQFLSGAHASLAYLAKDENHTDRSAIGAVVIAAYALADAMLEERQRT